MNSYVTLRGVAFSYLTLTTVALKCEWYYKRVLCPLSAIREKQSNSLQRVKREPMH